MQELCAANSGFEDSSMYPPASGANNIMHHVVSVGFVLAAEPISGRFDAIYLLEILMPEPAADKGQKPLFHSPIHCSPPFRNSGLSWIKSSYRCLTQPRKLADGSGIDLVSVCIIEYKIAPIQNDKAAIQPLSVVEALAPEFNFSHISKCLKVFQSFAMFCIESRCFTNSNS